jgi:hypothetical protein
MQGTTFYAYFQVLGCPIETSRGLRKLQNWKNQTARKYWLVVLLSIGIRRLVMGFGYEILKIRFFLGEPFTFKRELLRRFCLVCGINAFRQIAKQIFLLRRQ